MNVLYDVTGSVAVVTVNRPRELNILDRDVLAELEQAVLKAEADNCVDVMIITGAGRAFVAGADVRMMKDFSPDEAGAFSEYGSAVLLKIEAMPKPVIAAINGYALGGGCELAMACDIRIAGARAKFGQPETSLGVIPGFGATQRLPRIVGLSKAKELIFTAQTVDAEEALRIGLVDRVVPDEKLMDSAMEMANRIAQNVSTAVRHSKSVINKGMQCDVLTGFSLEAHAFAGCFSTEEQKNAMAAFVNKNK